MPSIEKLNLVRSECHISSPLSRANRRNNAALDGALDTIEKEMNERILKDEVDLTPFAVKCALLSDTPTGTQYRKVLTNLAKADVVAGIADGATEKGLEESLLNLVSSPYSTGRGGKIYRDTASRALLAAVSVLNSPLAETIRSTLDDQAIDQGWQALQELAPHKASSPVPVNPKSSSWTAHSASSSIVLDSGAASLDRYIL